MRLFSAFVFLCCIFGITFSSCGGTQKSNYETLLEDDFSGLKRGILWEAVDAHAEYHYLPGLAPKGHWGLSSFKSDESQRCWRVLQEKGDCLMYQNWENSKRKHIHPMIIAGDPLWEDYTVSVRFAPESDKAQSGLVFRYRNDRCYYFFGVDGPKAILKMVRHATAYHKPYEKILAEKDCSWLAGRYLEATVEVKGSHIRAELNNGTVLEADDSTHNYRDYLRQT